MRLYAAGADAASRYPSLSPYARSLSRRNRSVPERDFVQGSFRNAGPGPSSTNLDSEEAEIPWSRAVDQLDKLEPRGGSRGPTCWLTTTRADGSSHVAGVVGYWADDTLYFVSGPRTTKAQNIARDPRCSFAISLPDLDLVHDGTARELRTLKATWSPRPSGHRPRRLHPGTSTPSSHARLLA